MALKTEFLVSDKAAVDSLRALPEDQYYVTCGGRVVRDWEDLPGDASIHVHFRLRGGKGGFGSLLRSFRIHKSTNQLMCRDLNGRRIADVKEEERLRKWIAKAEEREKAKLAKKKEKYEKLKAGPLKHQFNDPEFKKAHDKIEDRVDDAFEAALKVIQEESEEVKEFTKAKKSKTITETDESDSEIEDADVPGPSWLIKKRKRKAKTVKNDEKKPKLALEEQEKENVVSVEAVVEVPKAVEVETVEVEEKHTEIKEQKEEVKVEAPKVFEPIDLEAVSDVASLEALGLDHLKFELESRNLKCGGTLAERAKRLVSVKGLTPDKYPKSVKAAPKKK